MKKDINPKKVEDVGIAIVKEEVEQVGELGSDSEKEEAWNAYLVNFRKEALKIVLIRSNGYGEEVKTSELRQMFDEVGPKSAVKIEQIMPEVFHLTNQYWVSFVLNNEMLDRKYVFVPGSIDEKNLVKVPILENKGILIL